MDEIMFGPMNIGMDPKRAEEEAKRDRPGLEGRQIIGGIIRSLSERGKLVIAILHDMDFVGEF